MTRQVDAQLALIDLESGQLRDTIVGIECLCNLGKQLEKREALDVLIRLKGLGSVSKVVIRGTGRSMVRLYKRQREVKDRSLARRTFDPDATALRLHQTLGDGQAEARAAAQWRFAIAS